MSVDTDNPPTEWETEAAKRKPWDGLDRPAREFVESLTDTSPDSADIRTACVYFAEEEGGYLKIGVSTRSTIRSRISGLRNANPRVIVLRRVVIGDAATEMMLHRYFDHLHVRGEWFAIDSELATVARLPYASMLSDHSA